MQVFISQPMNGKTNEEIRNERESVVRILETEGYTILDSIVSESAPETSHEGVWYLGKSILLLSIADAVYFMDGWEDARGCKIEHTIAIDYNLNIIQD